jgi:hypothetical protein
MRKVLHILTRETDADASEVVLRQRALPDCELETVKLEDGQLDYSNLLQKIFTADSVAVW